MSARKFKQGDQVEILTGGGKGVVQKYNAHGLVVVNAGFLKAVAHEKDLEFIDGTRTFTERQVSEAADAALGLIVGEIECDDEWEDLLSLMVNATLAVLKSEMSADLEEIVRASYGEDLYEFKSVRGF